MGRCKTPAELQHLFVLTGREKLHLRTAARICGGGLGWVYQALPKAFFDRPRISAFASCVDWTLLSHSCANHLFIGSTGGSSTDKVEVKEQNVMLATAAMYVTYTRYHVLSYDRVITYLLRNCYGFTRIYCRSSTDLLRNCYGFTTKYWEDIREE